MTDFEKITQWLSLNKCCKRYESCSLSVKQICSPLVCL